VCVCVCVYVDVCVCVCVCVYMPLNSECCSQPELPYRTESLDEHASGKRVEAILLEPLKQVKRNTGRLRDFLEGNAPKLALLTQADPNRLHATPELADRRVMF